MDLGGLSMAQLEVLDEIYSQGIVRIHNAKVRCTVHSLTAHSPHRIAAMAAR
jgi:hypothetical protein